MRSIIDKVSLAQLYDEPFPVAVRDQHHLVKFLVGQQIDALSAQPVTSELPRELLRALQVDTRMLELKKLPSTRANFAQRAFSATTDAVTLNKRHSYSTHQDEVIRRMVIHPDMITDELSELLDGWKTNIWALTPLERIHFKSTQVPDLRKMLLRAVEIGWVNSTSGKMLLLQWDPRYAGKLLVFQESVTILREPKNGASGSRPSQKKQLIQVTPHIYQNIFEALRGQDHTVTSMQSKIMELEILGDALAECRLNWNSYDPSTRAQKISFFREALSGNTGFLSAEIVAGQLAKLDVNPPLELQKQLYGLMAVQNRLLRAGEEKMSKQSFIAGKTGFLRNQVTTEIEDFFTFYKSHLSAQSPAQKAIGNYLITGINRTSLPENHKIALLSVYRAAEEFITQQNLYLILQLGEITELSRSVETTLAAQYATKPADFVRGAVTLYNLLATIAVLLAQYEVEDAQKRWLFLGAKLAPKGITSVPKDKSPMDTRVSKNTQALTDRLDRLRMLYKSTLILEAPTCKQLCHKKHTLTHSVWSSLLALGKRLAQEFTPSLPTSKG